MKSIKPGRGPSMMGAVGSAVAVGFGVIWTMAAASMGAPIFFCMFGVLFILMGIAQVIYNLKNATGKNRMSIMDITDGNEEPDPLQEYFANKDNSNATRKNEIDGESDFCPYCGTKVATEFRYCNQCGRKLP